MNLSFMYKGNIRFPFHIAFQTIEAKLSLANTIEKIISLNRKSLVK